ITDALYRVNTDTTICIDVNKVKFFHVKPLCMISRWRQARWTQKSVAILPPLPKKKGLRFHVTP
ncbi:hypothetical protein PDN76_08920, partial [Escherichia coli]